MRRKRRASPRRPLRLINTPPTPDYYDKSRFCETQVVLDNGETDTAYYRVDGQKDPSATDYNFDACFLRYKMARNECAALRPE